MKKLIKTFTIIMSVLFLFSCSQTSSSSSTNDTDSQTPGTQTPDSQTPDSQTPDTQTPDNPSDPATTFTPEELPEGTHPFSGKKFGDSNGSIENLTDLQRKQVMELIQALVG